MKILVGGREQIGQATLLVPALSDAWIEFGAGTWSIRINVQFVDDKDNPAQSFDLNGKDDYAVLVVKNWTNPLPMAIEQPFLLGETDGKKVVFLFTGYSVGGLRRLDFSFFWEKQNGQ